MSEELLQRNLVKNPEKIGKWDFYSIGATTVKALKEYGIIRNVDYGDVEKKKIDALIVQNKNVIAVIEYKKPSEFKTKEQKTKAIKQEIEVAQKLGSKIFIATDTKDTIWVNALTENRIKDWNGNEVQTLFDPKSEKTAELIEKIYDSINEQSDKIKPKQLINPTDLAKSIWQDIWSVSGATPENCLYTFVELFIFKYLSDLGVLKGTYNFYTLMGMYEANTENEVLEHYADIVRKKIKELFPENPIDKTTIINGTIFVSKDQKAVKGYSTTFRTVLEKFLKYEKLEYIDYDFKSKIFESFLKESISKKNWGQFFTPLKVVRSIVEMAKSEIRKGVKICDPACGVGKFLLEPLVTKLDDYYDIDKDSIHPRITIHGFDKGFDKDEQKTIILAKANMLIYFSDLIKENSGHTKGFAKLFNDSFTLKTNSILGTLSDPVENEYDLILTNPPYVTRGSSNLKDEIKKDGELVNYYKINAMGVEGLFMEWIIRALKPGGKAFVVIPDGILNRKNDKNLRRFILDKCFIEGIISLPISTFFTTPKKTYILCLTKKTDKHDIQKDLVFTYLVSEIGESRDIYRFNIEQNDLQEAVTLFSFFKINKVGFAKINSDKRCKIQSIEKIESNLEKDWLIDKWWSDEEKVELGILEERKTVPFDSLPELLEDVADNILEHKEEASELINQKAIFSYKEMNINEIFDIVSGFTFKKSLFTANRSDTPIIRIQNISEKNPKFVFYPKSIEIDDKFLIKKGDYLLPLSGSFFKLTKWRQEGKFYLNQRIAKFSLKDEFQKKLDDDFLQTMLNIIEREISKMGYSANNNLRISDIKNIKISIPIDQNGDFDLVSQKQIAQRYKKIEEIKSAINSELDKVSELNIDI